MSALPAPSAPGSGPSPSTAPAPRPVPSAAPHGQHERAPSRTPAAALRQLEARLAAVDPGWEQLRRSVRAVSGAEIALLAATPLLKAAGQASTLALLGAVVAMVSGVAVNDPARRGQAVTLALIPVPAAAGLVLGALVNGHQLATVVGFGAVIAVATYVRRYGPRFLALGFVGFMTFFFAQFLRATPKQVPWLLVAAVVGVTVAAVLRFVVLRDRPQRTLRRQVRAVQARAAEVVDGVVELVVEGPSLRRRRRLVRATGDLNAGALQVEQQLDSLGMPEHDLLTTRTGVLRLEVAVGHLVGAARTTAQQGLAVDVVGELQRLAAALRRGDVRGLPVRLAPAGDPHDPAEHLRMAVDAVGVAFQELRAGLPSEAWHPAWTEPDADPDADPDEDAKVGAGDEPSPGRLALRSAVQASTAGVLALLAGQLLSPTRWYWAVIAAFVVFTNVDTRTATVRRAVQRGLGTLVGVVGGLAVGALLTSHHQIALVVLFGFLVLGFWLQPVTYAGMSACITVVLAMLYVLLGQLSASLLELRVEETAVGAVVGGLAALVVLPARSGPVLGRRCAAVLDALADALRHTGDRVGLARAVREVDRAFQDLRRSARPAAAGVPTAAARAVEQQVFALSGAVRELRELLAAVLDQPEDRQVPAALQAAADAQADRAVALAARFRGQPAASAHPQEPGREGLDGPGHAPRAVEGLAARLDQLEAALAR